MKLSLLFPLLAAIVLAAFPATTSASAASRPNILIIVADDLGWGDVGWHGSHIKTPHLDKLVRSGVELDQHYVSPMCSPTRAAILSGRYASRFGVTAAQNDPAYFPETVTLARGLREAGYATAITGKWHLGSKAEWGPNKFGFEHAYGAFAGGTGPYDHRYKKGEFTGNWHRNGALISEEGHVTDLIAREAIRWIEGRDERPFFLYLPFTAPHIPLDEPQRWLDLYPGVEPVSKRHYAASVTHLDDAVGLVMAALERTGKRANTLIVFTSDNGATPTVRNDDSQYPGTYLAGPGGGSNLPLRGQKTELYEGGIRVPAFVNWPAKLKPGTFGTPLHAVDWMPTVCAVAGWRPTHDLKWDGTNVWPWLTGATPPSPRPLYWAGTGFRTRAVRHGDWKLIAEGKGAKVELFNLAKDPHEKQDLAAQEVARVAALQVLLAQMAAADIAPRRWAGNVIPVAELARVQVCPPPPAATRSLATSATGSVGLAGRPMAFHGWQFHDYNMGRARMIADQPFQDTHEINLYAFSREDALPKLETYERTPGLGYGLNVNTGRRYNIDAFVLEMRWRMANRQRAIAEDKQILDEVRRRIDVGRN